MTETIEVATDELDELVEQKVQKVLDERECTCGCSCDADDRADDEDEETVEGVPERNLTWMEQFDHFGDRFTGGDFRREVRQRDIHARIIWRHFADWGFQARNGDRILTTRELRKKILRKCDADSFSYTQMYRALDALTNRCGKVLLEDDDDRLGRHLVIKAPVVDHVALDLTGMDRPKPSSPKGRAQQAALAG